MTDETQPMEPEQAEPEPQHSLNLLGVIQGLMTILVVVVFVLTFLAQPFRIPSESMEPTLLIGDFVLVDKVTLAPAGDWRWLLPYRTVQRGDVVVFRGQGEHDVEGEGQVTYLVKRIVAVPGDHVRLQQGHLWLNGSPQSEPHAIYLASGPDVYRDEFPASLYTDVGVDSAWWVQMHKLVRDGALIVPEQEYFALGDNRNHSLDSRYWGFVPRQQIVGAAEIVYFSVRTPSPDDAELAQQGKPTAGQNDTMSNRAWLDFARWDRLFHVVR